MNIVLKIIAKCIDAFEDSNNHIICKFDRSLDILSYEFAVVCNKAGIWAGSIKDDCFDAINIRVSDNDIDLLLNKYCIVDCHVYYANHLIHFSNDVFNFLKENTATLLWKELGELRNPTIEQIDMYQKALNEL